MVVVVEVAVVVVVGLMVVVVVLSFLCQTNVTGFVFEFRVELGL